MRLISDRAGRRKPVNPFTNQASTNRMWRDVGARDMKDEMIRQFTTWAIDCPNPNTADDLWQFIEKARNINVRYE